MLGLKTQETKKFINFMELIQKEAEKEDKVLEIADMLYHLTVLMVDQGITIEDVNNELEKRSKKTGNLKAERKPIENL